MNKTQKTVRRTTKTALLFSCATIIMTVFPYTSSQATQADATGSFTKEQKAELEGLFHQYLMDNPGVIMESVQKFHEKMEKEAKKSAEEKLQEHKKIFASNNLPMIGNPDGDVTVVEFFDYNCGHCKRAFNDIMKLVDEDKNVRVIFQDLPILSPTSVKMAELGLAAKKQGKYFEMHKALMEHRGSHSKEAFLELAKGLGLDVEKLKVDAESEEVQVAISAIRKIAQDLRLSGTPGFIIGDKIYPGYIRAEDLLKVVKKTREESKAK